MAQCVKGDLPVPLYHFVLKTKDSHIPDPDGGEWPNDFAAHEEAGLVAQEIMRNQEDKTGSGGDRGGGQKPQPPSEVFFCEKEQKTARFSVRVLDSHSIVVIINET